MSRTIFDPSESSISQIQQAIVEGRTTASELVRFYIDRINRFDRDGPTINSIISINEDALKEAAKLDELFKQRGLTGPLHGIPLLVKDQIDVRGMNTTLGSVVFAKHDPGRDALAVTKLKRAGAIILGKTTLGEFGAGDTHGSLFGSTRNVFDHERTAGGSSGGSGAAVSANFCVAALGQEGFSSIRRPSAWNGIAGMRPTAGLVGRTGVYNGWPTVNGALGPMARNVSDLALVLDCMTGFDPEDPLTGLGTPNTSPSYARQLDRQSLKGARLGILRQSCGYASDPKSEDFRQVDHAFDTAVGELRRFGADLVDPIDLPGLNELLAARSKSEDEETLAYNHYAAGSTGIPFRTRDELTKSGRISETSRGAQERWATKYSNKRHYEYLCARDQLMIVLHEVMAKHKLDAIVHKAVEHQPTLIADGLKPPFKDQTGAIHINTFLVYVPSVVVPSVFTKDGLPTGITFLGRPFDDGKMLNLAYSYEQNTHHRRRPGF